MLYRKVVQSYSGWTRLFQKFLSTVENIEILDKKKIRRKLLKQNTNSNKTTISEEIRCILRNNGLDQHVDILPKSLLRKFNSFCSGLYFATQDSAKLFSSMISQELRKSNSFVIESNPGFGLLTQKLLSSGVCPIHLYEKYKRFLEPESPLLNLIHLHENKLHTKCLNLSHLWKLLLHDKFYNDNLAKPYFQNVKSRDWKDKTYVQIITANDDRCTLALILYTFFNQTTLFENGRPSFYLILPTLIWERVTIDHTDPANKRYYSPLNVMFHLFFDFKCLGTLPRKSFIPWPGGKFSEKLNSSMSAVHFEPKKDTYDRIDKNDLKPFWFFLKHCLRTNKLRVIKEFEKLVPGCGPKLILLNIHVWTIFKELDATTLLILFQTYKSWPEYDENSFIPPADIKMHEEEEEDEEEEAEEALEQELEQDSRGLSSNENEKKK